MTSNNVHEIVQTSQDQPLGKTIFTDLASAKQYLDQIQSKELQWDQVGFLSDTKYHNLLTLLFNDDELIDVFRFSLEGEDNEKLVSYLSLDYQIEVRFKVYEKDSFTLKDIQSKRLLKSFWMNSQVQSKKLDNHEITKLFKRWNSGREKISGRGNKFSPSTKRIVMEESHGRCMFSGCGLKLDFDSLTGHRGNFGYMAHNVASSENGPRGILYLSESLSDDPNNVLLLCDVHHRLIDRVAQLDYPANKLVSMRTEHIQLCNKLLNALNYTPIPVYFIPWSVNGQSIEQPDPIAISKSLSVVSYRAKHDLAPIDFGVNDSMQNTYEFHRRCHEHIENSVNQIKAWANGSSAAVFILGPTFALIGFGAKFGNKSKLMPMLRYRDASSWMWPSVEPRDNAFIINEPVIHSDQSEVIVSVKLTAPAPKIVKTIEHLNKIAKTEIPVIYIQPPESYGYGNGAIAHPLEGENLANSLKKIFTDLKEKHNIETVHLLVCASNAACVYIGQAVDRFQPKFIVYDYGDKMMEPKLIIYNDGNTTQLKCFNAE